MPILCLQIILIILPFTFVYIALITTAYLSLQPFTLYIKLNIYCLSRHYILIFGLD